jgi:hypothetical protein
MSDAAVVKPLKKDTLQSSRRAGGTIEFPGWDKRSEPFHTGTDWAFFVLSLYAQPGFKLLREAARSG